MGILDIHSIAPNNNLKPNYAARSHTHSESAGGTGACALANINNMYITGALNVLLENTVQP